jgi:PAS domain S-box-containing protein
MELLNHQYENNDALKEYTKKYNIPNSNNTFIQIFYSKIENEELILNIKNYLNGLLPNSSIMGTSTAGVIDNNKVESNKIIISFSIFDKSTTSIVDYKNLSPELIVDNIKNNLIQKDTKLLIVFANTFTFNVNNLIKQMNEQIPNIITAGGNSGDDFAFEKGLVFSNTNDNADVVITAIHSNDLKISTNYLLNWQTIGNDMTITKCKENIIFEIDNINAVEKYKEYLGVEVANNLPDSGIEFPLIFTENDIQTARAPIGLGENGSIIVAGNIKEGTKVKFGFANIDYIEENNLKSIENKHHSKSEGVYIYSCSTRKKLLGEFLDDELELISSISNTTGFITYGEFYHDMKYSINSLLNITTTYITLTENEYQESILNKKTNIKSKESITLKALTHLVDKTTKDLQNSMYYLKQFKNAMYSSSIFSSADKKGNIIDVNENFEKISGYKKEEIIGKPHNLVRHPDMKKSFFKKMWDKLKKDEEWHGVVKNLKKDGTPYYVLSQIFPIINIDGTLKEYISLRHDITDTERRRERLEGKVSELNELTEDKENLLSQYTNVIDSFASSYRFDTNYKIIYANHIFKNRMNLVNFENEITIKELFDKEFYNENIENIKSTLLRKEKYKNIIIYSLDNEKIYMDSKVTPILDKNGNIIEFMVIEYEITDILKAQQEIIDTQKDIIFTMGEIGETRSKETGNHVKRVAGYSKILALLSGLDEEKSTILKMASPMHDIGKVGIPDHVLNKPGKLDSDEWEIMKTHSELGYSMLKGSNREIMKVAAIVARFHHEKWNGTGYPQGLSGEDIPIEARITAVADVFDALGSDRVYKKSWELEKIYDLLKSEKGKHFDPNLIDLFFNNIDLFLEIRDKYKDIN